MISDKERDIIVIKIILKYCREVDIAIEQFGKSYEIFRDNVIYHNSVSMSIYQVGEISNHLSEEFKDNHPNIPWRQIRAMRNLFAHQYYQMDFDKIWDVAIDDIPVLSNFCKEILK